jgi:hypothetical protein
MMISYHGPKMGRNDTQEEYSLLPTGLEIECGDEMPLRLFNDTVPNAIKSRRLRWAGHVARTKERRGAYRVLAGKPQRRDHSENPGVGGRIILKWILEKWDEEHGLDRSGSG